MKVKDLKNFPIKIMHTHNSIPGFYDGLDEGCTTCIENKTIDLIGNKEIGLSRGRAILACVEKGIKASDVTKILNVVCNTPNLIEFKEDKE